MNEKICIYKASPLMESEEVPSVELLIRTEIPETRTIDEAYSMYQHDAEMIADALFKSLPQAALDRLITELMGMKANRCGYKGRHREEK